MHALLLVALIAAAPPSPAVDAWEGLGRLEGTWEARGEGGRVTRASYRFISNNTVLVETYVTPSGRETMTLYHPDGAQVVATHYCAQGNQPRLHMDRTTTGDRWLFTFMDATNLPDGKAAHLTQLELRVAGKTLERVETYVENGTPEVGRLTFVRQGQAAPGK